MGEAFEPLSRVVFCQPRSAYGPSSHQYRLAPRHAPSYSGASAVVSRASIIKSASLAAMEVNFSPHSLIFPPPCSSSLHILWTSPARWLTSASFVSPIQISYLWTSPVSLPFPCLRFDASSTIRFPFSFLFLCSNSKLRFFAICSAIWSNTIILTCLFCRFRSRSSLSVTFGHKRG